MSKSALLNLVLTFIEFPEMPAFDSISGIITVLIILVALFILFRIFKVIMTILLFAVFLIAAYITNPDYEDHLIAVREKANDHSVRVKEKDIKVEDYKIISLTKAGNDGKLVGIGAFTQVWIFNDLKDLDQ